mmetsp:Transcript_13073/g.12928  ORF Transcript_13073/g.12928 Transcript_13073/m.12928 type:complete len:103 (-) Transcript_13073:483-791(-)
MKNSDIVFFNEFQELFKRKEYNHNDVTTFFKEIKTKDCHECGKKDNSFFGKWFKSNFCHFCMKDTCSKECLIASGMVIPRNVHLNFDLQKYPICQKSALFLS